MAASLTSRGLRGYLAGALAGFVSAALFGVAFSHAETLFMVAYLAAVPLFIAGLGAGVISAAVAAVVGVAGLAFLKRPNFAVLYGVIYALPATVLTTLALRRRAGIGPKAGWYSEGNILTAIVLYPCIAFLAAIAAAANHPGGLLAETKEMMTLATAQFKDQVDADTFTQFMSAMDVLARMLPAMLGCSWIVVMVLSMILAQITLKQQGWNLRSTAALKQASVPAWLLGAPVVAGLAGYIAPAPYDYIGINLCIMLLLAYFCVGLAVVHAVTATWKGGTWALVVFYVLLAIPLPWTAVPMAVLTLFLGITDQWIDFRRRFAGKKQGG